MAKKKEAKQKEQQKAKQANGAEKTQPRFQCLGQAVRDMSFECPVPAYLFGDTSPEMDLNLSVSVMPRKAPESSFDVTVAVRIESKHEQQTLFLAELAYGGLFLVEHLSPEQTQALLHVDAPALLYPFARQLLMSTILEGGYHPPVLDVINFGALYQQSLQRQAAQAPGKEAEPTAAAQA